MAANQEPGALRGEAGKKEEAGEGLSLHIILTLPVTLRSPALV